MRRYVLTLSLLFGLLLAGGLATADVFGPAPTVRGAYVPTLSADPQTAQLQALIFTVGLAAIILSTVGLGVFLAVSFVRFTRLMAAHPAGSAPPDRTGAPKPAASGQGLDIPFSSHRSVAVFWIVVVLLVAGFQGLRYLSQPNSVAPFGYLPGLGEMLNMPLFRLPGTHIDGLPALVAGPGDPVTALHVLLAVLGAAIVSVIVVGIGLARGTAALDATIKSADKLPRTLADRLIPVVESRLAALRQPRPKRLPGNPIDSLMIGVNVVLLMVIAAIVVLYVVPSYGNVAAVDNAIEATRVAALGTARPPDGGPGSNSLMPAEFNQAEFDKLPPGVATDGQLVYQGAGGCGGCHSLDANVSGVGPPFGGLGERAATRRPGYSAEAYVYESITNPNAYLVEGFQGDLMPQTFLQILSPQQIADVIAFLLPE